MRILKKNKILISGGLTCLLLSTQVLPGTNSEVYANTEKSNMMQMSEEVDEINYVGNSTYEFSNGEQLLEETDGKGNIVYKTTDENGNLKYKLYKNEVGEVVYEDLQTGETGIALKVLKEDVTNEQKMTLNSTIASDGYSYVRTTKNSTYLQVARASAIAGALALILPFSAAALIWVGQTYASFNAPSAYWYEVVSNKINSTSGLWVKTQYIFHEYSNYNSYMGYEEDVVYYTGGPR